MAKPDLSEFLEKPSKECIASRLIVKLDKEDRGKVEAALLEKSIDCSSIVRFMQKRGIDMKHPSLLRHRNRECMCFSITKNEEL